MAEEKTDRIPKRRWWHILALGALVGWLATFAHFYWKEYQCIDLAMLTDPYLTQAETQRLYAGCMKPMLRFKGKEKWEKEIQAIKLLGEESWERERREHNIGTEENWQRARMQREERLREILGE